MDALVGYMDHRGTLVAPKTIVERWSDEVGALVSMNVLVEDRGDRLLFAHQPYLDYLTAVRVLQDVLAGSRNVLGWLLADDQSLFRRGQLRQLLALLRDDDLERYLESMQEILGGEKVRFHLKHLALQVLGHADAPMDGEVDLVLELLGKPEWVDHVFFQVLAGREAWFDMLYGRGVLQDWLADRDESRVKFAINLIERRGRDAWRDGRVVAARS